MPSSASAQTPTDKPSSGRFPVVCIGASAGGIEALQAFAAALPETVPVSIVVILHLPGDAPSQLAELLMAGCAVPVRWITDGDVCEQGVVHVLPPGSSVEFDGERLRLSDRPAGERWRPVDRAFTSLADQLGDRAIAVLLSGTGTNGCVALGELRAAGGVVVVQDPTEAAFADMPRNALATGHVDRAAPSAELARLVVAWGERWPCQASSSEAEETLIEQVLARIRAHTGRDFSQYKRGTIERRLQRRAGIRACPSTTDYLDLLRQDEEEIDILAQDLLIGVTGFFRDPATWQVLSERVLPESIAAGDEDSAFRAWVAGCASGEEAYSLAILVYEQLERRGHRRPVQIFATDIDPRACERARRGIFPAAAVEDLDDDRRAAYFTREDGSYRIAQSIRDLITFAQHDLLRDPPFSQLDLICCRNVLIYLDGEAQERVLGMFHFAMRRGGVLLLGGSETVQRQGDLFDVIDDGHRCYRRRDIASPAPAFSVRHRPLPYEPPRRQSSYSRHGGHERHDLAQDLAQQHFAPAFVLVDQRQQVCYYSGPTGDFLHQPEGLPSAELLSMADAALRPRLSAALHRAMQRQEPVILSYLPQRQSESPLPIEVTVHPVSSRSDERLWMVSFRHQIGASQSAASAAVAKGELKAEQALDALDLELRATREELSSSIEELETSNEELKASNEETRSMYEELQSTNEELETSREELQAVNEELGVVNRRLGEKLTELVEAKDVLGNLLSSTNLPTIFLDRELCIQRFTPAAAELLRLIEGDVGRPFVDLADRISDGQIVTDARRVLATLVPTERELATSDGSWYLLRVHPYRTANDSIEGVVATLSDVGELKRAQVELAASEDRYRSIFANAAVGIVELDRQGRIGTHNRTMSRLTGIPDHLLAAGSVYDFLDSDPGAELARVIAGQVPDDGQRLELPLRSADGERWLRWTISVLADERVIAIVEDVTERHAVEQDLRWRSQELKRSNEDLTHFAAMASHDLQAPLRLIGSYLDLIDQLGEDLDPETRKEYFAVALENVRHMRSMITDLLDYAHCELAEQRIEPCASKEALDIAIANLRKVLDERGADIVTGDLPLVRAPRRLLIQVFQNLIDNASKYGREGVRPRITIEAEAGQDEWIFHVADNGRGIPAEQQRQIFDLFDRSNAAGEQGTGLGLAICRKGIERLGGRIRVESTVGSGTTFTFCIPEQRPAETHRG